MNTGGVELDIYNYLGFDKDNIIKSAEKYTNKKYDSSTNRANKVVKVNEYSNFTGKDASDFFAGLGSSNQNDVSSPLG